ncbi:complement C5-like [Menidia menidia]
MADPEGLQRVLALPSGSAQAALDSLLPLVEVYGYLEATSSWDLLGPDVQGNAGNLTRRIKDALVDVSSFRKGDNSYSMWMENKPSTMVTAEVVGVLSKVDPLVPVDHQPLSDSVNWLINVAQQSNGAFVEKGEAGPPPVKDPLEQSVYLTSTVLIALHRATSISDPILQRQSQELSKRSAADYISQNALGLKSVHVRALATYALALHDPDSYHVTPADRPTGGPGPPERLHPIDSSPRLLHPLLGNPVELRFWQESGASGDWLKPDQSSGAAVEMTAYVLLAVLLKGRIPYANPILAWLTQDQHYGQGFFSMRDAMLTLEAVTMYSRTVPRAHLSQDINIRYSRKGLLQQVRLTQTRPVATPLEITKDDDIIVSTGFGKGVSSVKLKTVYYQTTASNQTSCHFDLTVEVVGPDVSDNPSMRAPHLTACAKYVPPPGGFTESRITVMKIQLPTGLEPQLEDLRQFRDGLQPVISDYQLEGSTVIIQMESVPSDVYLCVGFRVKTRFRVIGAGDSLLTVTQPQLKGSLCSKTFSDQQQKLQRICMGEHCQCMKAACAGFRGKLDTTLPVPKRKAEICQPHVRFAFKLMVKSSRAEGDFMTYSARVVERVWTKRGEFEAVRQGTEVNLVKKATCNGVELRDNQQYMVIGSSGSEYSEGSVFKYRVPLDSDALVEQWPTTCLTEECSNYMKQMADLTFDLDMLGC